MNPAPVEITVAEYDARLRVMLRKGSGGFPRRSKDRWILLRAIASGFRPDEPLAEKAFTARIQDFLLDRGRNLGVDAVTLRRALVDEGFVERDGWGREYRASSRHERRVRFVPGRPDAA